MSTLILQIPIYKARLYVPLLGTTSTFNFME